MTTKRWTSVEDVANYLGVVKDPDHRWIETRSLLAHEIGRPWRLKRSEVDDWVRTDGLTRTKMCRAKGARNDVVFEQPGPPAEEVAEHEAPPRKIRLCRTMAHLFRNQGDIKHVCLLIDPMQVAKDSGTKRAPSPSIISETCST